MGERERERGGIARTLLPVLPWVFLIRIRRCKSCFCSVCDHWTKPWSKKRGKEASTASSSFRLNNMVNVSKRIRFCVFRWAARDAHFTLHATCSKQREVLNHILLYHSCFIFIIRNQQCVLSLFGVCWRCATNTYNVPGCMRWGKGRYYSRERRSCWRCCAHHKQNENPKQWQFK